jgi:purine-binding chemotaxis protein CheW
MNLLTFDINGQNYAVALQEVDEVLHMARIKPLPDAPDFVCGVLNLRGDLLPVMDLGVRLGACRDSHASQSGDSMYRTDTRLLLIRMSDIRVLIILDGWSGLINFSEEQIREGVIEDEALPAWVDGMVQDDQQLLQIIKPGALLSQEQLQLIRRQES